MPSNLPFYSRQNYNFFYLHTLLKIKVLQDALEEPCFLNGFIKILYHPKSLSASQKVFSFINFFGKRIFFRL